MTKKPAAVPAWIVLDPSAAVPLYEQLYEALREAILSGRLVPGTRVPSTRSLRTELNVSRTTAVTAYERLLAEGYLEGKVGSGTYIAGSLPEEILRARAPLPRRAAETAPPRRTARLSRRGATLASAPLPPSQEGLPQVFRTGLPALDEFPFGEWSRIIRRLSRRPTASLLAYGSPPGYGPLKQAIAEYLSAKRAVRCEPGQVIVVSGAQQALDLAARVLLDPGDEAWVEDPGYPGTRGALTGAGAKLEPVPVDEEGLHVDIGKERAPRARMACVTPSHQFPLGAIMSLPRRLKLLEWADRADAWVLEDDYDSEYRYTGRPLPSLQGLDTAGRVIYAGTFSKVLFPSLRLGYLVVPSDLVDAFVSARTLADRHPPSLEQAVLAEFMMEGHFERHLRRTRKLCVERQRAFLETAKRELAGLLEVNPTEAGMHLVGWLPEETDDRGASLRAAAFGVETPPVSAFSSRQLRDGGLVFGYAAFNETEIEEGVKRLAPALG